MAINPADGAGELVRRITDAPVTRPSRALTWRQQWTQEEIQTESDELDGTRKITKQALDAQGEIAECFERVLRRSLDGIGKDLDDAAAKYLDEGDIAAYRTGSRRGELQFTGTRDIPYVLRAVAPNIIDNEVNGMSSVQELSNMGIGRVVARNRTAPEEPEPRPVVVRRGFFGQLRQIEG